MPMYTVKGIKFFEGEEGTGFNATLYRNGKRIARVSDYAHGGPLDIRFEDDSEESELQRHVDSLKVESFECDGEVLSLPLASRVEVFINNLVERTSELNQLFRKSRSRILFIENREIFSIKKAKPTKEAMDMVRRTYKVDALLSEMQTVEELERALDQFVPGYLPSLMQA